MALRVSGGNGGGSPCNPGLLGLRGGEVVGETLWVAEGPGQKELVSVPATWAHSCSSLYNQEQLVLICSESAGTVGLAASRAPSPEPWRERMKPGGDGGGQAEALGSVLGVGVRWSASCMDLGLAGASSTGWRQMPPGPRTEKFTVGFARISITPPSGQPSG